MDINRKFNLVVMPKSVVIEYLAADLVTVNSRTEFPVHLIYPYTIDYLNKLSPFVDLTDATTFGAILLDVRWENPTFRWMIPYANINTYSTDGSTYGAKPIFADVVGEIIAMLNL